MWVNELNRISHVLDINKLNDLAATLGDSLPQALKK